MLKLLDWLLQCKKNSQYGLAREARVVCATGHGFNIPEPNKHVSRFTCAPRVFLRKNQLNSNSICVERFSHEPLATRNTEQSLHV